MNQGRCLCGTVRFEIDGPYTNMLHCHCSMCRKHHGAAFATFVAAPIEGFRYTSGESAIGHHASSPGLHRSFCTSCGSVMPEAMASMGLVVCPAGNLDGDLGITPGMHMFTGSKAGWSEITDTAGAFVPATGIFTAPVTGFYLVAAEIEFSAIAAIAGAEFSVQIWVNGAFIAAGVEICQVAAANVKRNPKVTLGVQVTAGQTIDIRASQTSGSGANALTFVTSRNLLSIQLQQ